MYYDGGEVPLSAARAPRGARLSSLSVVALFETDLSDVPNCAVAPSLLTKRVEVARAQDFVCDGVGLTDMLGVGVFVGFGPGA
jgi:hypothetical protein